MNSNFSYVNKQISHRNILLRLYTVPILFFRSFFITDGDVTVSSFEVMSNVGAFQNGKRNGFYIFRLFLSSSRLGISYDFMYTH